MLHQEYIWHAFDNTKLFAQSWQTKEKPKVVINLIHGLGEHSGRYSQWSEWFQNQNCAVLAFDLRGHGRSEGKRGYTPSYQHLMKDIDLLLKKSQLLFPDCPKILYGHSLGGNLALNYVITHHPHIEGIISTSPLLRLFQQPPEWQTLLVKNIIRIYPSFLAKTRLKASDISHNPEVVKKYKNDPLVHDLITARLYFEIQGASRLILSNKHKVSVPLLLMHGTSDRITSYNASCQFANNTSSNTTFKGWTGMYHELHNENNNVEVFNFIVNWIDQIMGNKCKINSGQLLTSER